MAVATPEGPTPAAKADRAAPDRRVVSFLDRAVERRPRVRGTTLVVIALAPAVAALWCVRWFLTQDSPAHVYNAEILARSFDPDSPFARTFAIRWQPIPNWVGHVLLAGLIRTIPAWAADRIMTGVTLVGFAAAVFWLRLRISRDGEGDG